MDQNGNVGQFSLKQGVARHLSDVTISVPMMEAITPRWLLTFLPWVPVKTGVYRINKMKKCSEEQEDDYQYLDKGASNGCSSHRRDECGEKLIDLISGPSGENDLPRTFADYTERPQEISLSVIQTILRINTTVSDIYNVPINQLQQQMRLTVEGISEKQEWELVNNKDFGLIHSVPSKMRLSTRKGSPTPDDMDELLSRVWKKPAFFLAHPRAIAAFGRECTRRGVPPATVNLYGSPFMTWRGVPLVPSDKLLVNGRSIPEDTSGTTNILLMRVGESEQGVIGLHQPGIPDEQYRPSLAVKFSGIDNKGISHYVMNLYFSLGILTDDAVGMLENVEVGSYYDYA